MKPMHAILSNAFLEFIRTVLSVTADYENDWVVRVLFLNRLTEIFLREEIMISKTEFSLHNFEYGDIQNCESLVKHICKSDEYGYLNWNSHSSEFQDDSVITLRGAGILRILEIVSIPDL